MTFFEIYPQLKEGQAFRRLLDPSGPYQLILYRYLRISKKRFEQLSVLSLWTPFGASLFLDDIEATNWEPFSNDDEVTQC